MMDSNVIIQATGILLATRLPVRLRATMLLLQTYSHVRNHLPKMQGAIHMLLTVVF